MCSTCEGTLFKQLLNIGFTRKLLSFLMECGNRNICMNKLPNPDSNVPTMLHISLGLKSNNCTIQVSMRYKLSYKCLDFAVVILTECSQSIVGQTCS